MHVHVSHSMYMYHTAAQTHCLFTIPITRKKTTTKNYPIMLALLGHNAFAYYAQNYAGIIRMSLDVTYICTVVRGYIEYYYVDPDDDDHTHVTSHLG